MVDKNLVRKDIAFAEMAGFAIANAADQLAEGAAPMKAVAIAHLWFGSIHSFSDGNGRIGRAVIEPVFSQNEAQPFSLSPQIEIEKKAYYAALQAGGMATENGIDASEFVNWFLRALLSAGKASNEEARFLVAQNRFFNASRDGSAR